MNYAEAVSWSLFRNSLTFTLVFAFLAFYVLKAVPVLYQFPVAAGVGAALTWQLSVIDL